ncbi:MAG: hypothetical protein QG566_179 [Patescibacteria group bacterium]|jgi:hypothetical protein|nr:hypothetical protein [Patescibacteria group bacterium]
MKKFNIGLSVAVIALVFTLGFNNLPFALAASTPTLGMSAIYGVLSSTYTDTSGATTINGSVGFTTPPASSIAGTHASYGSGAPYAQAGSDQGTALSALASEICTFTFAPGAINLSTDVTHGPVGVYTPGVYCSTGAMNVGGPLELSGAGTYIFRPVGAFTTTAGAVVTLTGSSACDVFYTPSSAATIAENNTFFGNIISAAGITIGANTTWTGRALAFGGTVTTDTDTITVPSCSNTPSVLRVVKNVVNDNSGNLNANNFNLYVKNAGVNVTGSPATGVVSPGTSYWLTAGVYAVSEDNVSSYEQSFGGDCDANGNITLGSGVDKTCTITNNDVQQNTYGSMRQPPVVVSQSVIATPIVAPVVLPTPTPKLPSTGFAPKENNTTNNIIALSGIALLAVSLYALRSKKII